MIRKVINVDIYLVFYTYLFLMQYTILALKKNLRKKINKLYSFILRLKLKYINKCKCKIEIIINRKKSLTSPSLFSFSASSVS